MPAEVKFPSLSAAKAHAQRVVGAAYKGGQNPHQKFAYASKEEIARVAKEALAEAGLSFELRGPVEASENGWLHFVARLDWEGGSFDEWDVFWDASGERAPGAAKVGSVMSYAHKNALLNCLNIPRETEETHRNRVDDQDMRRPPSPPRHAPAPPQPPPPQAAPEGAPSPRERLSERLKGHLGCDLDGSNAVIQMVSEVDGHPLYSGWQAVARSDDACLHVLECIQDFLTTLSPDELVRNARLRATERASMS